MSNNFKLLIAILVFSSCALAQHQAGQSIAPHSHNPPDSTCAVTYASGSGLNATQFCVTENGNIVQFSVNGLEFIDNGGTPIEGYGLCDETTNTRYLGYIAPDTGWQAPTFSVSGNVVTVIRITTDGIWQLKQTITNVPATATAPGSAKVSMALKNLTGVTRTAEIVRDAYVSIFGTTNDYNYTSQTAFALIAEGIFNGRGFSITNNTFSSLLGETAFVNNIFDPPDPCVIATNQASQPFVGQGSLDMFWAFTVAKGATKTVVSTYHPI